MVDTVDLKSIALLCVRVRVPPSEFYFWKLDGGVIGNSKGSCPLAVGSNPAYPFFLNFIKFFIQDGRIGKAVLFESIFYWFESNSWDFVKCLFGVMELVDILVLGTKFWGFKSPLLYFKY